MKKFLISMAAVLLTFLGILAINSKDVIDSNDPNYDDLYQERMLSLVNNRCSGPEGIDRRLLQQSWFYTENFQDIAVVFGQASFSLHEPREFSTLKEGAYCIEGSTLQVQYFTTEFVPTNFDFGELTFSPKISRENTGKIVITRLDSNEMSFILDEGEEQTVYRKY